MILMKVIQRKNFWEFLIAFFISSSIQTFYNYLYVSEQDGLKLKRNKQTNAQITLCE